MTEHVVWEPQPGPQTDLLECPIFEVMFGGARGGGKSDGMLGEWIRHASLYKDNAIGLMIRRTRVELVETIERSRAIYTPLGWKLTDNMWRAPDGARLRFAYLERDADADGYQGHSYSRVYVEEIGNFPSPKPIFKLMATLRSGAGVPVGFRATGNPGGPGHGWVRGRYITPAPAGYKILTNEAGEERVFIPSRLTDNSYLDYEAYVRKLKMVGSPALVKAWLEGDWNAIEGAFFEEFGDRHVLTPAELPKYWLRFRSMDWGSARPFSVGWWAVATDDWQHPGGTVVPRGAMVRYREWYGSAGPPDYNTGLKLTAEQVAEGIRQREDGETITFGVLDPSAFAQDGGPSIADRIAGVGVYFNPADNKRVAKMGALGGWDQLRARLVGDGVRPALYVWSTCTDLIRTLPVLQHDADRPEDLDTESEDHAADEARYACMARPYVKEKPEEPRQLDRYRRRSGEVQPTSWLAA